MAPAKVPCTCRRFPRVPGIVEEERYFDFFWDHWRKYTQKNDCMANKEKVFSKTLQNVDTLHWFCYILAEII